MKELSNVEKKKSESKEKNEGVVEGGGEGTTEGGGDEGKTATEGEEGGTGGEDGKGADENKGGENGEVLVQGETVGQTEVTQTEEGEKRTSEQSESIPVVYKKSSIRVTEGSNTPVPKRLSEGNAPGSRRTSVR